MLSISQLGHRACDSAAPLNVYMCAHFLTATYTSYCPCLEWMSQFPSALNILFLLHHCTICSHAADSMTKQHSSTSLYRIIFIYLSLYFRLNIALFTTFETVAVTGQSQKYLSTMAVKYCYLYLQSKAGDTVVCIFYC